MPTQTWGQLKDLLAEASESALNQVRTIEVSGKLYDTDATITSENVIDDSASTP